MCSSWKKVSPRDPPPPPFNLCFSLPPQIYAEGGKRYLDFTTGIGVTNLGHCHPRVTAAVQARWGGEEAAEISEAATG